MYTYIILYIYIYIYVHIYIYIYINKGPEMRFTYHCVKGPTIHLLLYYCITGPVMQRHPKS